MRLTEDLYQLLVEKADRESKLISQVVFEAIKKAVDYNPKVD